MQQNVSYNALEAMQAEAVKHAVQVKLPGSNELKLHYLLLFQIDSGSLIDDFLNAYGTELKLLAEKVIGYSNQRNNYGVLFDENMTMVFAFNTLLADYDRDLKRIVYRDPQEVLSILIESPTGQLETLIPDFDPTPNFPDRSRIVFRYAIVDPRK